VTPAATAGLAAVAGLAVVAGPGALAGLAVGARPGLPGVVARALPARALPARALPARGPGTGPAGPIGSLTGRGAGQRLARAELSKAIYHPHEPLTQRVLNAIGDLLNDLTKAGRSFPGGWWAVVALTALLAALITVVLTRTGPLARTRRAAGQLMAGSGPLSAAEHRISAGRLAAAGDYAGAIREQVRAIARELDERAVLTPRAGRTANEMAEEAAAALPAEADALRGAALMFDDICYGERPGTQEGYALVRELDTRISAAVPKPGASLAGAGVGSGRSQGAGTGTSTGTASTGTSAGGPR
jgi:hypothetical protein